MLAIGLAVVVMLLGLHVYNFVRIGAGDIAVSAGLLLERAREISEHARPEYQDLALARLARNAKNGSFYRFDDNLQEASIFGPSPEGLTGEPGILLGFEFDDPNVAELVPAEDSREPQIEDGLLTMPAGSGDDYLTNSYPLALRRKNVGDIQLRVRAEENTWLGLAWSSDGDPQNPWKDRFDLALVGDGEFHTYLINGQNALRRGAPDGDNLARVFVRPATTSGTTAEIDFIRFLSRQARYLGARNGVSYEMFGGEMRKAIYMLPDQTLEWSVDVPEDEPVLGFGSAVLLSDLPVNFEVAINSEEGDTTVHLETTTAASEWRDVQIDLAPWAGERVRLRLSSTDAVSNVAFWSNPILRSTPRDRFNAIIVLEDTTRADYLSTYGYELETSPHKTALMRLGAIQFDWAISQATKTRPSVASLMTSLYPTATGVWHFSDALSERYLTLAEIMRSQGFTTGAFIQNGNAGPYAGGHQGFSQLFDPEIVAGPTEAMLGSRLFGWLDEHRDENFFLYMHILDPHGPYEPSPPYDAWHEEAIGQGEVVKRDDRFDPRSVTRPTDEGRRRRYAGEIRHNDELLAGMMDKLDALGLTENTLVIFLSDHGEYMGEHGRWEHNPPGLMPVVHVPLMLSYPSRFKESARIDDAVQLIDVMPTILDIADIDRTGLLLQGDSLVDLIEGQANERWHDRIVVSEEPISMTKEDPCACASLFHRDWHVISSSQFWPLRGAGHIPHLSASMKTRVFKFRDDPKEEDLLLSFGLDLYVRWLAFDFISELRHANIATWRGLTQTESVDLEVDPDTLERLRTLGYVR